MNYNLADVTHIEFDKKLIFEPKLRIMIGSDLVEIVELKKYKNPYEVFAQVTNEWLKAKKERNKNGT